jgi:hypothetical protein
MRLQNIIKISWKYPICTLQAKAICRKGDIKLLQTRPTSVKLEGVESISVKVKPLLDLEPVGCSDNPLNLYLEATLFENRQFTINPN